MLRSPLPHRVHRSPGTTGGRHRTRDRHSALPSLVVAVLGSLALALSMNGTMSALTAKITNTQDTAGVGTHLLEVYDGSTVVCRGDGTATDGTAADGSSFSDGAPNPTNAALCTFDLYGGSRKALGSGQSTTRSITVKNAGTMAAKTFTLTPGACTAAPQDATNSGTATDLCAQLQLKMTSGGTTVFSGSLTSLNTGGAINLLGKLGLSQLSSGSQMPLTITVTRPSSMDESYRNLQATQPLTWKTTT